MSRIPIYLRRFALFLRRIVTNNLQITRIREEKMGLMSWRVCTMSSWILETMKRSTGWVFATLSNMVKWMPLTKPTWRAQTKGEKPRGQKACFGTIQQSQLLYAHKSKIHCSYRCHQKHYKENATAHWIYQHRSNSKLQIIIKEQNELYLFLKKIITHI